jgi:hypothetical protein
MTACGGTKAKSDARQRCRRCLAHCLDRLRFGSDHPLQRSVAHPFEPVLGTGTELYIDPVHLGSVEAHQARHGDPAADHGGGVALCLGVADGLQEALDHVLTLS